MGTIGKKQESKFNTEKDLELSKKVGKHWIRACIICDRIQYMRKNQRACSTKLFGQSCARELAIISTPQKDIDKRMTKAWKSSIKSRKKKALNNVKNLTPVEAYQKGYQNGYDAGWKRNIAKSLETTNNPDRKSRVNEGTNQA